MILLGCRATEERRIGSDPFSGIIPHELLAVDGRIRPPKGHGTMSRQRGRGGMGSHKHGVSGRAGPPRAVKWATAQFFNKEAARRKAPKQEIYRSVREALHPKKPR